MADVDLRHAYLISGSDEPKVETAVARLRAHFPPEAIERVSAVDCSGADAVTLCNAGSLFGDRRLVIVEEVDRAVAEVYPSVAAVAAMASAAQTSASTMRMCLMASQFGNSH